METQKSVQIPMPQSMTPPNPLAAHFRQPKISVKLPSLGRWWGEDALDLPPDGEIPVYAMTARDEIALKTPDTLMNGTSLVSVIQSCCPNIKDAWQMPTVDLDTILIAIRIASYGDNMDVTTTCPKCEEESTWGLSLGHRLNSLTAGDYDTPMQVNGLEIHLEPQQYYNINRLNQIRFQEERIGQVLIDAEMPDQEKAKQLQESFQRLIEFGIENVTESTARIVMPDGTEVVNKQHIMEFYSNVEGDHVTKVQAQLAKLGEQSNSKPLQLKCTHCENQFETPLEFDYANFFGTASSN